jgi:hypothetical protein
MSQKYNLTHVEEQSRVTILVSRYFIKRTVLINYYSNIKLKL